MQINSYGATRNLLFYTQSGGAFDAGLNEPLSNQTRLCYYAFLMDKTNTLKKIYLNGDISAQVALIRNVNMNTPNNIFALNATGASTIGIDHDMIFARFTTLSTVPADIDTAIKRMYQFPMTLDASLVAVAVLASQWDIEDQIVDDGTHTYRTIQDHGVVGGYNLTSSVDLEDKIVIAEKVKPTRPPRTFYVFDDAHIAANANIDYGFTGGLPLVLELIFDLKRRNLYQTGHYVFRLQKDANNDIRIDCDGAGIYRVTIISAAGNSVYYIYPNLFDFTTMHILLSSTYTHVYLDGQLVINDTATPRLPNLSGACAVTSLGGTANVSVHNICGARIWEWAFGPIPGLVVTELKKKVIDPWRRADPVIPDAFMVCEWLLDSNVAAAATSIPNTEPGGGALGPLAISGGTQFQNSRRVYRQ